MTFLVLQLPCWDWGLYSCSFAVLISLRLPVTAGGKIALFLKRYADRRRLAEWLIKFGEVIHSSLLMSFFIRPNYYR